MALMLRLILAVIVIVHQSLIDMKTLVLCRVEDVPPQLVKELRSKMLMEAKANPAQYDPRDIERVRNETTDWHVRRYLMWYDNDLSEAYNGMRTNFKWRKSIKLNSLTPANFPCQFFDTGFVHLTKTRSGQPLMFFNLEAHGPFASLRRDWYNFLYWNNNQVDLWTNEKGFAVYIDMSRIRVANFDLQGIQYILPGADRFPAAVSVFQISNAGPLITPVLNMVLNMLPRRFREVITLVDGPEAFKLVKRKDLSDTYGGRQVQQRVLPIVEGGTTGCESIWKMAKKHGWPRDDVQGFLDFEKDLIRNNREKHGLKPY